MTAPIEDPSKRISDWDRIEELLGANDASAARGRTARLTSDEL